ncbi:hypothetical protein CYMTET_17192 [Cymbomonas tetramitiformis]|uniref:Uncharacterized protein n=1 Tax=Cymbomonas tetramitiformis TaxID=36881 RepID=A0AAE0GAX1_9CHLO|nr:hypothetical protein CYMTET_17192 [Cymbomonas tetramitiformis]
MVTKRAVPRRQEPLRDLKEGTFPIPRGNAGGGFNPPRERAIGGWSTIPTLVGKRMSLKIGFASLSKSTRSKMSSEPLSFAAKDGLVQRSD